MQELISAVRARTLIVSFNDEGYIPRQEMEALLASRGPVTTIRRPYKRYVGARIGIHNPAGEKVGRVSHLDNHELLYVTGEHVPDLADLAAPQQPAFA